MPILFWGFRIKYCITIKNTPNPFRIIKAPILQEHILGSIGFGNRRQGSATNKHCTAGGLGLSMTLETISALVRIYLRQAYNTNNWIPTHPHYSLSGHLGCYRLVSSTHQPVSGWSLNTRIDQNVHVGLGSGLGSQSIAVCDFSHIFFSREATSTTPHCLRLFRTKNRRCLNPETGIGSGYSSHPDNPKP